MITPPSEKYDSMAQVTLSVLMVLYIASFPFINKCSILLLWPLALAAISVFIAQRKFHVYPTFLFLWGLFALRLVSFLFQPELKFSAIEQCLSLFVLPLCFSLFKLRKSLVVQIMRFAFYALTLIALVLLAKIIVVIVWKQGIFIDLLRFPKHYYGQFLTQPFWWHPSFVSIALAMAIPLAFYLRFEVNKITRLTSLAAVVVGMAAIYFTGARIGIYAIVGLLLLSELYYFNKTTLVDKLFAIMLLCGVLFMAHYTSASFTSDPIRHQQRAMALVGIAQHPWTGSGVACMKQYISSDSIAQQVGYSAGYDFNHFHNVLLDELLQFGYLGTLPLVALIIYLIVLAVRRRDYLLMAFLVIYLPFFWVENPLQSVKGIMPMVFWLCFFIATQKCEVKLARNSRAVTTKKSE